MHLKINKWQAINSEEAEVHLDNIALNDLWNFVLACWNEHSNAGPAKITTPRYFISETNESGILHNKRGEQVAFHLGPIFRMRLIIYKN